MINERDISEKFSAIWKQNLPLMTPSFMRVFNEARIMNINSQSIPTGQDIRYDIVAEISFNLAHISTIDEISVDEIIANTCRFEKIISETAKSIWTTENYTKSDLKLEQMEVQEICKICENTLEFIKIIKEKEVQFEPKLRGYGFIPDLTADLSIDDTLYEIKTVNRNFKSSDLKQLFIYLALRQVGEGENWKYAGLYNPRKGTYCKFNVKSLIYNLSGGKTPNETFENLLNGLVRDIEIDSKF